MAELDDFWSGTPVADVFEEVEEQLRAARYQQMVRKGWPFAVGLGAILLIGALLVWGYDKYQNSLEAKASDTYSAGLEALGRGDLAVAEKDFGDVSKSGPRGYKTLALMQLASVRLNQQKPAEALSLFDEAAKSAPDKVLGDGAKLKAALVSLDLGQPLPVVEKRLEELASPDRPYKVMAREALGMARLANGKTADARRDFATLTLLPDASDAQRGRAKAIVALIDAGGAADLPQALKLAKTLPPQAAIDPAQILARAQAAQAAQAQSGAQR